MIFRFASLTTVAAAAIIGLGCAPKNTASIQPYAICAMPDDCTFSDECDAQFIGTPMLDLSYGQEMWLAVEVHNQLEDNSDDELGRVNTHDAHFESYTLSYGGIRAAIDSAGISDIPGASLRAQQLIPAGGNSVIGFEPFPIGVVDALLDAGGIPAGPDFDEVTVTATFKGRFDDGSKWEAALKFPVRLCTNCLLAVCEDPTETPTTACPSLAQAPRGAAACEGSAVSCVAAGTFCGSNVNVSGGSDDTLYACTGAGDPPANSTQCPNGCNAAVTPNVCNP